MSFESDIKRLVKNLKDIERNQIPYAATLALNETAKDVKKGVERQLNKDIDKPTPFTQKAFRIFYAKKKRLQSSVYIQDKQAEYLEYQIFGGSRRAKRGSPVIIPRKSAANKYGNLPRGKLKGLKKKGKYFTQNKVAYQKNKKSSKPLAYFADKASYRKRFKFYERGTSTARKVIFRNFQSAMRKAIRTAR